MRKVWLLLAVVLALLMSVGSVAAGGRPLSTTLSGANEISGGDPDGSGTAHITLNQGQGEVCFEISVANLDEPITRAHIHSAPAGSNGPIVVNFVEAGHTPFSFSDGFARGCVAADPDLIKAIRQNPEDYYVNVHNVTFPGGAVRGQLSK